jgi:hypothetical protein
MEKTENLVKFREEFDFLKKMEDLKMEDKKSYPDVPGTPEI